MKQKSICMKHIIYNFMHVPSCQFLPVKAQQSYTLKKCLEEGLANNYSIRITRNEEQISHNNATLANAGYLPTVDLSAGYTGTLDNTDTKSPWHRRVTKIMESMTRQLTSASTSTGPCSTDSISAQHTKNLRNWNTREKPTRVSPLRIS